jgi:hypothetical protein
MSKLGGAPGAATVKVNYARPKKAGGRYKFECNESAGLTWWQAGAQQAAPLQSQSQIRKQRSRRDAGATEVRVKIGVRDYVTRRSGVLLAVALDEFFQVFTGGGDVLPESVGRDVRIFGAAGVQKFVVGFAGQVQIAGED